MTKPMAIEPEPAKNSKCAKSNELLHTSDDTNVSLKESSAAAETASKNEANTSTTTSAIMEVLEQIKMETEPDETSNPNELASTPTLSDIEMMQVSSVSHSTTQQAQEQATLHEIPETEAVPSVGAVATPTTSILKPLSPVTLKVEADIDLAEKSTDLNDASNSHEATPTIRPTKITRSSLNGTRTPTMLKRLRKSTRSTRFKAKMTVRANGAATNNPNGYNAHLTSGLHHSLSASALHSGNSKSHGKASASGAGATAGARNRRTLFKRPAQKTPKMQASTRFVKSVFYKDSYVQIGDIVSIVDSEQNVYYAQIRGLLVDAYCEKSAFLTWLIPTQDSPDPKEGFDPATYLIGPDEELSRKLSFMEFVMHAPSNYYYDRTTPFPLPDAEEFAPKTAGGYMWTRLPVVKRATIHKLGT